MSKPQSRGPDAAGSHVPLFDLAQCCARKFCAKVSFVATQAQFTPKTVETKTERDKLMFRIRVRIDPERLRSRGDAVRSGLPGVAYIRTDPTVAWPDRLRGPPT